jgi:hypothetical protein
VVDNLKLIQGPLLKILHISEPINIVFFDGELEVKNAAVKIGILMPAPVYERLLKAGIAPANEYFGFFIQAMLLPVQNPFDRVLDILLAVAASRRKLRRYLRFYRF